MPVVKFADTLEKGKERLKAINWHFEDQLKVRESPRTLLQECEEALKKILQWAGTEIWAGGLGLSHQGGKAPKVKPSAFSAKVRASFGKE